MYGGNDLKYGVLLYPDHLQNWLDYGNGLVIFLILVLFWLSETGQIWGFQAFSGKPIEEMAWNFACWCILTTFSLSELIRLWLQFDLQIFLILMLFWLSETGKIWGFQAFWSCSVDFPHYGDPLAEIGHIWGFWGIIWRTCGSKCRREGGGIFPTLCVECCLVFDVIYREVSNISHTLVGNYVIDHWDVVGALPVSAAPTTSSFSA